jgi:type III secretory pathway component EscU
VGDAVAAWTKAQPYGAAWEPWRALGWRIAAVALAVGAGDALLGRWLRWRRLHMTDAEARAARHEGEASPAMRQRLRQGASASPAPTQDPPAPTHIADPTDWRWAALTITDDAGQAAACLSYAPPLIDPPHLAKIAHGDAEVAALVEAAHARGVAVAQEPPILRALLAMAVRVGQPIPHALFEPVGRLMGACGVSGEDAPRA